MNASGLVMRFGGITATNNVSLQLRPGARHALIGPNGAGKTTLINLLTGVLTPTEGRIELLGEDITRLAPHQRVARGMVRTFQINQLFDSMTPLETLALVVSQHRGLGAQWWKPLGETRRHRHINRIGYWSRWRREIGRASCRERVFRVV